MQAGRAGGASAKESGNLFCSDLHLFMLCMSLPLKVP